MSNRQTTAVTTHTENKMQEGEMMILRKYWKISRTGHDDTIQSSQVKFLLSTQIQNSPPLVPGAGSLRRRQNLNHPGAR